MNGMRVRLESFKICENMPKQEKGKYNLRLWKAWAPLSEWVYVQSLIFRIVTLETWKICDKKFTSIRERTRELL